MSCATASDSNVQFFLDFDGTITQNDVIDTILERFALPEWRAVEQEWASGKIGSRECLTRQAALVRATPDELKALVDEITVDPHFIDFLKLAKEYGAGITIVSDGLDFVIRKILNHLSRKDASILKDVSIFSNTLEWTDNGFQIRFPDGSVCEHACANCKQRVIESQNLNGDHIVFVGDGLSDRYAAHTSHLTFAKGKLLNYCQKQNIQHKAYENFADVAQWLAAKGKVCR